jgi:uncharacterized repeat protein (TIGR01451 family)
VYLARRGEKMRIVGKALWAAVAAAAILLAGSLNLEVSPAPQREDADASSPEPAESSLGQGCSLSGVSSPVAQLSATPCKRVLFIHDQLGLFDENPLTTFSILPKKLRALGLGVEESFPSKINSSVLSGYDVVVFSLRWWNSRLGQRLMGNDEAAALVEFVNQGKGLLLVGELGLEQWSTNWNGSAGRVGQNWGITFDAVMLCSMDRHFAMQGDPDDGVDYPIIPATIPGPVTDGVGRFVFAWGTSLKVRSPAKVIGRTDASGWRDGNAIYTDYLNQWTCQQDASEPSGRYPALASARAQSGGRVVAVGDSSWMSDTWIVRLGNLKLAQNAFTWLARIPVIQSLTADTHSGDAPLVVEFTCKVNDQGVDGLQYHWDFDGDRVGDLVTSIGQATNVYEDPGTYEARCTVVDPSGCRRSSKPVVVKVTQPRADLAVGLNDSPDPVSVGKRLTYTAVVRNHGPSRATGVRLTDKLPPGLKFISATSTQGSCTYNTVARKVTCTIGQIADAESATIKIVLNARRAGTVTNTVGLVTPEGLDPNDTDNTASEATRVNPRADLSVTLTDSPDPVPVGRNVTYTAVVTNHGPSRATRVKLTDKLPPGLKFISATSTQGSCTYDTVTRKVACTIGEVADTETATVKLVLNARRAGTVTNTVRLVTPDGLDPNGTDNTASEATRVKPRADLSVTLTDSPDPVSVGGIITYTAVVANNGPSNATGVNLSDLLPPGMSFVSAASTQGSCTYSTAARKVTCAIGGMANTAIATITIVATAGQTELGVVTNTVDVTGAEYDPTTPNQASTTTTVNRNVNLGVTQQTTVTSRSSAQIPRIPLRSQTAVSASQRGAL